MHPNTRACLAYIANVLVNRSAGLAVYDYSQSKRITFTGSVNQTSVSLYDHERHSYIAGTLSNLYDHDHKAFVSLSISGCEISGYDFSGGHQFCGTVDGHSVTLVEYDTSHRFCYRCVD